MTAPKQETMEGMVSATPLATGAGTIDARRYSACEVARKGLKVQIRSLRPDDGDRIAKAFSKLSQDSIHSRFFGARSGLTEGDHRMIRELDFDTGVVLPVTIHQRIA